MKTEKEIASAIDRYGDMVKRICLMHLKSEPDTEDIFQEVFVKYMMREEAFMSPEHEKAWFARVTMNACRDLLKSFFRRKVTLTDQTPESSGSGSSTPGDGASGTDPYQAVREIVLALPEKYRDVIYLYYYEEYSVLEIAQLLGKKENTIYTNLARGRKILKEKIGGQWQ